MTIRSAVVSVNDDGTLTSTHTLKFDVELPPVQQQPEVLMVRCGNTRVYVQRRNLDVWTVGHSANGVDRTYPEADRLRMSYEQAVDWAYRRVRHIEGANRAAQAARNTAAELWDNPADDTPPADDPWDR